MCLKRAGSDGVGTAAKRARVEGPAASSLTQLAEHCRFGRLAEMLLAHHSSVDPICVKTVKPGTRKDVHRFGKVPRALLRDVWDHQLQAHVYEVLFPTPPPRSCPAVESAVAAETAAAVAKVYLDLEPSKAQQTRGGITLAQGVRLLPLAFEVLSSALQESYGVAWRYDADRDALAVSCGRACLGLFARVEAEKLNSTRCLDWQRLTDEMNIAVVVDAADGCEEREKHDRGWLLDKYADTVLLETTAEYEAVKLALEREECLPHSFGMKVNKKVLATMGAECDDPVALVPPAGLSDHERARWTVDAEKERRRIVRSAMRRHDFDKNHQEAGDFRENLYDWFFATLHKGESRASKYWELLRIANIKCSSDEILQGLHEKDRLAEVATERQKTAIATKKAADLLKKLGVTLDDVVPSIKGGVSTWAAPGVDGRTLKAVPFEKGQFPDADFQCLSVVGLMAVAVSTTRCREKRVNGHKLRTDHLAAVKRAHPELKHQDAVRLANASYTRQKRPTRSQTTVYEIKPDDLGWKRVPEPECKAVGRKPGSLTYADYAKLDATPLKDKGLAAYCRANLPPPPTLGMLALLL